MRDILYFSSLWMQKNVLNEKPYKLLLNYFKSTKKLCFSKTNQKPFKKKSRTSKTLERKNKNFEFSLSKNF